MEEIINNQLPEGFTVDEQPPQGFTVDESQGLSELPQGFTVDAAPDKMAVAKSALLDKITAPKQESFQEANRRRFSQFIEGVPKGLGNAFVGGVQAATDLGESAARGIEGAIYGDTMNQETFGDRLAGQVTKTKAEQAQLPAAERAGIFAGEVAPYVGVGAQSGLVKGGAMAGAAMGLGQQREEAGLGGRIMEGAEGAAMGAAGGGILKGAGAVVKPAVSGISGMVKRLAKSPTGEDILEKIVSPEEAGKQATRLAAREGRESILPDIAGDEVAGLARMLAKTPGSKNIINTALNNRTATSSKRVSKLINDNVSSEAYFGSMDDLKKARAEISAPLYKQAYQEGAVIGEKQAATSKRKIQDTLKDKYNIDIYASEGGGKINLSKIVVDKSLRNQGVGSKAMDDLVKYADETDQLITLTPSKDFGGSVPKLKTFYKRFGFVENKGSNKDYSISDTFFRSPEKSIKKAPAPSKTSPQLKELLQDERITSALKTAQKDFNVTAPVNSVEALHGARQAIDDTISVAMRAGEKQKARAYLILKSKLNETLYKASPTLREADNTFAGFSALEGAQVEGLAFNKSTPEELKRRMASFTAGEKDAFKIGVRESLRKSIAETTDSASAARKLFAKAENRDRLKVVFSNQKQFADFSRKMFDEIRIFNAKNRILGGSRTDINLADEAQIIDKVAGGMVSPKFAVVSAIADSIKKRYIGLNETNAKELAQILVSKQKSIDALRRIAAKAKGEEKTVMNQFLNDVIPTIVGRSATKELTENN